MPATPDHRPFGVVALAVFFVFGAAMSGLTALLLAFPGTIADAVWKLHPQARDGLLTMGIPAIALMAVVSLACATAALGLSRRAPWGYWTAILILSANLTGDVFNALIRHDWRTLIGLPIGGAMIAYLVSRKAVFRRS